MGACAEERRGEGEQADREMRSMGFQNLSVRAKVP